MALGYTVYAWSVCLVSRTKHGPVPNGRGVDGAPAGTQTRDALEAVKCS